MAHAGGLAIEGDCSTARVVVGSLLPLLLELPLLALAEVHLSSD